MPIHCDLEGTCRPGISRKLYDRVQGDWPLGGILFVLSRGPRRDPGTVTSNLCFFSSWESSALTRKAQMLVPTPQGWEGTEHACDLETV